MALTLVVCLSQVLRSQLCWEDLVAGFYLMGSTIAGQLKQLSDRVRGHVQHLSSLDWCCSKVLRRVCVCHSAHTYTDTHAYTHIQYRYTHTHTDTVCITTYIMFINMHKCMQYAGIHKALKLEYVLTCSHTDTHPGLSSKGWNYSSFLSLLSFV